MAAFLKRVRRLIYEEDGPTTVEYATLLGIIAAGVLIAMGGFGEKVHVIYVKLRAALSVADAEE